MNKIATLINIDFVNRYFNNENNEPKQIAQLLNQMNSYIQQNADYQKCINILNEIIDYTKVLSSQITYLVDNINKSTKETIKNNIIKNENNNEPEFLF